MRFLRGFAVAIIARDAEVRVSESGQSFVDVLVEFDRHAGRNGNPYSQRIGFRSFEAVDIDQAPALVRGTIIGFEGTVDAVTTERNGRVFANPRVTGRILQVGEVGR